MDLVDAILWPFERWARFIIGFAIDAPDDDLPTYRTAPDDDLPPRIH